MLFGIGFIGGITHYSIGWTYPLNMQHTTQISVKTSVSSFMNK